jgi:hypothetical protein
MRHPYEVRIALTIELLFVVEDAARLLKLRCPSVVAPDRMGQIVRRGPPMSHCSPSRDSSFSAGGQLTSLIRELAPPSFRGAWCIRLVPFVLAAGLLTEARAQAQTPSANLQAPHPTAAAPEDDSTWGGNANLNAQLQGGTQQQNSVSLFASSFQERGRTPRELLLNLRERFDFGYGNAKKPGNERITTTEMLYGEARISADAHQLFSATRGSVLARDSAAGTGTWVYGIAAWYHHIAFDLHVQQAYGVGVARDHIGGIPGLAIAVDVRHVQESFDSQPDFASWAARVHQSYSHSWVIGPAGATRVFLLGESLELIPMFKSAAAFQARSLVSIALPITGTLSVPIAFGSDYLGNASFGFKPLYWKTTIGLQWTFGPK